MCEVIIKKKLIFSDFGSNFCSQKMYILEKFQNKSKKINILRKFNHLIGRRYSGETTTLLTTTTSYIHRQIRLKQIRAKQLHFIYMISRKHKLTFKFQDIRKKNYE